MPTIELTRTLERAGVAGLQAIATARRLGAVVSAFDVRAAVKEQVESLGASFLELGVRAQAVDPIVTDAIRKLFLLTPDDLVRQILRKVWIGREFIAHHRHHRHGLDSTGDANLDLPRLDRVCHMRNRLYARRAIAVDGLGGDRIRQTCAQGNHARYVEALLSFRERTSKHHIFNLRGVQIRRLLE